MSVYGIIFFSLSDYFCYTIGIGKNLTLILHFFFFLKCIVEVLKIVYILLSKYGKEMVFVVEKLSSFAIIV